MHLFQIVDAVPILFIFAMRPDREAVSWEIKTSAERDFPHRYKNLTLKPLVDDDCISLTKTILNSTDLPDRLRYLILASSEGNPYFIEEVIRTLIDGDVLIQDSKTERWRMTADVESIVVPDNLHALLAARFDGLDEDARHVLQVASIVGTSFQYSIMQQILKLNGNLDNGLATLQQQEFITEGTWGPDRTYAFRSTLLHEIVYRSILRKLRSGFHQLVAETLIGLYSDNIDDLNPELAHHFYQAGDERAVHYLTLTGDDAFQLYANDEAEEYYGRALEIAQATSTTTVDQLSHLFSRRGRALELNGQFSEALSNYVAMEEWASKRQVRSMELAAILAQTTIHSMPTEHFDFIKVEELAERALEMARLEADKAAEAKIYWNLLNIYRFSDNLEKSMEFGQRSLALARAHNLQEQMAYTANDISHAYMDFGNLQEANVSIGMASDLWRELDNRPMLADSLATAGIVSGLMGQYDLALAQCEEAYQISKAIENSWGQSYARMFVGNVLWERGEPDRAIEMMESCLELGKQANFIAVPAFVGAQLAQIYTYLGDFKGAEELANDAQKIADDNLIIYRPLPLIVRGLLLLLKANLNEMKSIIDDLDRYLDIKVLSFELDVNYFMSLYLSVAGDLKAAGKLTDDLISTTKKSNAYMFLPRVLRLKGEILHKKGRLVEASQVLREAQTEAESIGAQWPLWQILAAQARLHERLGDSTAASNTLSQATLILETIADRLPTVEMRNSFLTSPYVGLFLTTQGDDTSEST